MKTAQARRRRGDAVMKSGGSDIGEGRDEYECHSEELADARQQMAIASGKCRGVDISLDHRLNEAVLLKRENKLLAAAELLEGIDCIYFAPVHHIITKEAGILKEILRDCSSNTKDADWTKRVEKRGKNHFSLESKLKRYNNTDGCTDSYDILTFRVVTSIEASMLVPVLAVLNESELFSSWAPKFKVPRFGVSKSERLLQLDRCSQVALLEVDHPWPLGMREMIVKAVACEDISTSPSRIVSSLQTMDIENDGE